MPSSRPRILIDCDPGHDDVVALVAGHHYADLVGITTVHGNAPLERTTYNARVTRELLGSKVPIHSGADRPLIGEPQHALSVHGESGLDGAKLPTPTLPLDGDDAVKFIIEQAHVSDDLWLVPVGPLTNVALALRAAPGLATRLAGISLMGGGTFGNRTAAAEFNFWADPEAAQIVFTSGVPITMAGLDVTHQFQITPDRIAELRATQTQGDPILRDTLAGLFEFFSAGYTSQHRHLLGAPLHDPMAVLALTNPEIFTSTPRHVSVEANGTYTRGMSLIDQRDLVELPPANCTVLDTVDADRAWDLIRDAITAT